MRSVCTRRLAVVLAAAGLLGSFGAGCDDGGVPLAPRVPVPTPSESMTPVPGQEPVVIRQGFRMDLLVGDLPEPTSVAVYEGKLLVTLNGTETPEVVRVEDGSTTTVLAGRDLPEGVLLPPLTSVRVKDETAWITHRQMGAQGWLVGAISRFEIDKPTETFETVITNLPSTGDHYTEDLAFGPEGRVYFAQGSATNSGVVGPDNASWLMDAPGFHDYPPVDLELAGSGYKSANPLSDDPDAVATTAAYRAFDSGAVSEGTPVAAPTPERPVDGMVAGNAAVYSFDPEDPQPVSTLRVEAWGFRNPYGIGFDPAQPNLLFVSNNGADVRSKEENGQVTVVEPRPIGTDLDDLFVVDVSDGRVEFFGWPDYFHDPNTAAPVPVTRSSVCKSKFVDLGSCEFVLSSAFRESLVVDPSFAQFELHSSADKFDFSSGGNFGNRGDIFVAETGSLPPVTGATDFSGFKVVHVDRRAGVVTDLVANRAQDADALFDPAVMNKPIDVKFQDSATMIIVDLGVLDATMSIPSTGKLWVVTWEGGTTVAP